MADETRVTDTEGVVTDTFLEKGPPGPSLAHEAGESPDAATRGWPGEDLAAEPEKSATTRRSGGTYVVNNGGDPRTWRTVELDKDGNATGARIGRIVVRDDGALALEYLEQQAAAELNAAEIALLERRLAEAKGEL